MEWNINTIERRAMDMQKEISSARSREGEARLNISGGTEGEGEREREKGRGRTSGRSGRAVVERSSSKNRRGTRNAKTKENHKAEETSNKPNTARP